MQPRMIKVTVCHFTFFFIAFLVITWPQYCQEAGNQFGVHPPTLTKNVSKLQSTSKTGNFPAFSIILKPSLNPDPADLAPEVIKLFSCSTQPSINFNCS